MNLNVTKICVPVDLLADDGDALASEALNTAVDLAKPFGADLVVVSVLPPPIPKTGVDFSGEAMKAIEAAHGVRTEAAEKGVERLCAQAGEKGVKASGEVVIAAEGIAPAIWHAASEAGADLIVVNSHGRRGIKRLLLGSVAERLAHLSEVPVLVLKEAGESA